MAKNDKKIKIKPLNNTTFDYIVSRKNFWGNFTVVATATLTPNENYTVNFSKSLSSSERHYIHEYFMNLIHLKIELAPNCKAYHVYKDNKLVAMANIHEYEVLAVDFLTPAESAYLSRYFRIKLNETLSTL